MAKDFSKIKANDTLKSIADKSRMLSNTKVVVRLPVDKLKDHPDNEYLFGMKEEDIDHMAEGIIQNGFKDPVEVYDNQDGTYLLYSGHIRKYGAIRAGLTEIEAIVYDKPEETVMRRELLGANLFGRNRIDHSDPIMVARQLEYHMHTLEMEHYTNNRRKQVAKDFGFKSDANVHKYMVLLSLIPELQEKVSVRAVPYSGMSAAAQMTEEEQHNLNNELDKWLELDTITRKELEYLIKSIREKKEETANDQMNRMNEDSPDVLPEPEQDITMPAEVGNTGCDKSEHPEDIEAEADEDIPKAEDSIKGEVVHREQPEPKEEKKESKIQNVKEDSKEMVRDSRVYSRAYIRGGMLNTYMRNVEKTLDEIGEIQYENPKESLELMKRVKMILEDEIDRINDFLA